MRERERKREREREREREGGKKKPPSLKNDLCVTTLIPNSD